MVCKKTTAGH
jgi:hypothetical protein